MCFYHAGYLFFLWEVKRAHGADYLVGANQKIPEWSIKITFLVEVETTMGYILNLGLVSQALAPVGLCFLLFNTGYLEQTARMKLEAGQRPVISHISAYLSKNA